MTIHVDLDELRRLCAKGLSDQAIGNRLGLSGKAVRWRRTALGIPASHSRIVSFDVDRDVIAGYAAMGMPDRAIAELLGCAMSTLRRKRMDFGIPSGRKSRNGNPGGRPREADELRLSEKVEAEFTAALAGRAFTDHPGLKPATGPIPTPLKRPSGEFSGCGNAAIMCALAGDSA